MPDAEPQPLRLIALDRDDLDVISAHLQDAVLTLADTRWLPLEGRFAMALDRVCWEATARRGFLRGAPRRRPAALHFERVGAVQCTGFDPRRRDTSLRLLAIRFDEKDPPSGDVLLLFAGHAAIRLSVECLEAQICDLEADEPPPEGREARREAS